ncbi:DUF4393 domain-containing protein [Streptococcus parasuis]|uniref:DUF4393 domain-containing protein n=1 Tax=Streptococcus parasuis TaxID=1501662 RepID=UPI00289B9620|nr:DUF4393 domain-containing protein [Streptococcus parasuis]
MDELLPTILTSFATTMAVKGAESPANTFNETWKYVFGPIDSFLIRKNEKRRIDNEKYILSLTEKVEKIPLEQIQEPKISILGPALEASKFYIEEEEIREMFASLLASSFDSSKNPQLHHSFVEIIKQMSPLDAQNLIKIATFRRFPVARYSIKFENNTTSLLKSLVFIPVENLAESADNSIFDFDRHATSITNLERLGLIKIDFGFWLSSDSRYSLLENNPLAEAYKTSYINENNNETLHISKGIIDISPLGMDFYTVCLSK